MIRYNTIHDIEKLNIDSQFDSRFDNYGVSYNAKRRLYCPNQAQLSVYPKLCFI